MKKYLYNLSFILSILIITIFVLKKVSYLGDNKPNSIVIINDSGKPLMNFLCKHQNYSILMESFDNESSFEFSFISSGESHLEMEWFTNDSIIHKKHGYYTSGVVMSETVTININNEIVSKNRSVNSGY